MKEFCLSNEGMDSYEESCETEVSIVNFHEKMYYGSDIKKSIEIIKEMIKTWHVEIPSGSLLMSEIDKVIGSQILNKESQDE